MATNVPNITPGPLEDLTSDVYELQRHIAALELEAREAKRPWHKQASILISAVALIISATFSTYTAWTQSSRQRHDEVEKRLETLRATVLQIEDLRNEWIQAQSSSATNSPQFMQRESLLNTKKQVLIENADAIISDVQKYVSPSVFEILAYETQADSRFAEAETYYQLGLQSEYGLSLGSRDTARSWLSTVWSFLKHEKTNASQSAGYSKLFIKKDLAALHMQPNTPLYDATLGRTEFRDVTHALAPYNDEYALQSKAYVWMDWAAAEFAAGNIRAARDYLMRAQDEAKKMAAWDVHRETYLQSIAQAERMYQVDAPTLGGLPTGPSDGVLGGWEMSYPDDPTCKGNAYFYSNAETKSIGAIVTILKGSKLIKKYVGTAYMVHPDDIRIDWTGSTFPASAIGPYVVGTTVLKMSKSTMVGREYSIGDEGRAVHFAKVHIKAR